MALSRAGTARAVRALVLPLFVALVASTLVIRIADPDTFVHVAVGRWMLAHRAVPTHDPFSFASAGPVRYVEVLADASFALVTALGGFVGLQLFHAALGAACLGLVVARSRGTSASRALVAALVLAASFSAMALKPQVFSYLLFAGILLWIDRAPSRDPRRLLGLPLLFVLWANLHRGGVFGVVALVAAAAGLAWSRETRPHARMLAAAALLCVPALLANSGGTYYITSAFDIVQRASFHAHILEWQPLTWALVRDRHLAIVPLVALALAERALRSRRVDAELAVLAVTFVLASKGARLLPFVAIAAAPAAVRALDAIRARLEAHARPALVGGLFTLAGLAVPAAQYEHAVPPGYRGFGICEGMIPVDLGRFLADHRPPGPLFHGFDFSGYLLYALAPETKVLIDGRNDTVYSDDLFQTVIPAEQDPSAFATLDRRFRFAVAAFHATAVPDPRGAFLARDPAWVLVYWDDLAIVYAHRTRAPDLAARLGYRTLRVDSAQVAVNHPDDPLLDDLHRNAREAPRSMRAHYLLAAALRARGQLDEARSEANAAALLADEKGLPPPPPLFPL